MLSTIVELSGCERNTATVEEMYRRYADMVYRIAFLRTRSSADADDVLQNVFLRYISRQPQFNDDEHSRAWFIRTAINCSLSLLTSAWNRHTVAGEDELLERMEYTSEVYHAVLALPVKLRTAIHLYYYEGYTVREGAKITGSNESTYKSWLYRAREALRQQLKEEIE